jgi:hypothetical protein
MSAFQAYAGAYEFEGEAFNWRCYATARVHAVRRREHAPFPSAPPGRKWLWRSSQRLEPVVAWLVDEWADEFSHMLLQVQPNRGFGARLAQAV